ncbi:ATP-binding protein [Streptomyces glaucescens]|uniref:Anti-sigma factor n=1 Tax=Streptomyces glaucescens TaxID=1907 RepID=A0A089XGL7_STRGA|nr:ATP-binding protein [Streptomyces glaucescens]AIS01072.1 anti-sigma factor [Streptomyces glaucescens]
MMEALPRRPAPITLPIGSDADLARVRQHVRQVATELGFGLVQQTKLVTAASELARNTLVHGGGGQAEITPLEEGHRTGLRLSFVDQGPGIRDVALAMTDGYTTGGGLGLGLSGAERLVHEFAIDTGPGRGTTVTAVAWVTGVPAPRSGAGTRRPGAR